jgi:L-ascorbate metabolism protein UlaG (beta-lactamase superfamily)
VAALAAAGAGVLALARSTDWLASLGAVPEGERRARILRSPRFRDGRFRNPIPTATLRPEDIGRTLRLQFLGNERRSPSRPIPVERRTRDDFARPPASGLRLTWIGHASVLIEIDGRRFLTDPVWSERVSPSTALGPRRFFPPPIALEELPDLDAVVVSHDHYDHLDMETVRRLDRSGVPFLVPLGVGAHLERWGVASARIRELDWGEAVDVGGVVLTAGPARHFSGRGLVRDRTLWCSWSFTGPRHRVFYSGDTGDFDEFRSIGAELGPFDATLMSLGAYGPTWPDIHMEPESLVRAHRDLRGGVLVAVHWATFNLAFHAWNEPARRAAAEARRLDVRIAFPRPGGQIEPGEPPGRSDDWWMDP